MQQGTFVASCLILPYHHLLSNRVGSQTFRVTSSRFIIFQYKSVASGVTKSVNLHAYTDLIDKHEFIN